MRARLVAACACVATACLFPSVDGFESDAAVSDVTTVDAQDTGPGSDAGPDGDAASWLVLDDFEDGYAPYVPQNATATLSTIAHTGSHSCQVCCDGTPSYCTLDRGYNGFILDPTVDASYTIGAWVRAAPQTANGNLGSVAIARTYQGSTFIDQAPYNSIPLPESWVYVTSTVTVSKPADGLAGYVGVSGYDAGDCFLVDDVTLSAGP